MAGLGKPDEVTGAGGYRRDVQADMGGTNSIGKDEVNAPSQAGASVFEGGVDSGLGDGDVCLGHGFIGSGSVGHRYE